jgi:hypothetical protein
MNAKAFGRERRDFAMSFRWGRNTRVLASLSLSLCPPFSLMNFEFVVERFLDYSLSLKE